MIFARTLTVFATRGEPIDPDPSKGIVGTVYDFICEYQPPANAMEADALVKDIYKLKDLGYRSAEYRLGAMIDTDGVYNIYRVFDLRAKRSKLVKQHAVYGNTQPAFDYSDSSEF